jgi:Tol biopolymer transport system component
MPLDPGTRLGPYEVVCAIGAGGMGEVYRARDTKLNRDVALKVLPAEFALEAERLARFEREAQVLASLNHPNIAAIYGFEDSGGTRALVLEVVEGPTLADRIARGPIPLDEAVPIARQLAEALEAAHEQGIIHRDLKPANIKVRDDGTVKVLDFGLAKALESSSPRVDLANSPTITSPAMMTGVGTLLGTAAYMAPEQARGKRVDKRADIWAFGVVLYELVTGRKAFEAEDITDTLAKVIQGEPRWEDVPFVLRRLLRKCLEKDPRNRLRDMGDAWDLLDDAAGNRVASQMRGASWLPWAAAVGFALAGILALWAPWRASPPPPALLRFHIYPPAGTTFANDVDDLAVVSPDGTRIAFRATGEDGRSRLWIRDLDTLDARRLDRTEEAHWAFWSPDSRWIAYFSADSQLKKVLASGGPPQTLCSCSSILKGIWGKSGVIVFGNSLGMAKVSADGGTVTPLTKVDPSRGETVHVGQSFLPDGRHFLYARVSAGAASLSVGSVDATPAEQTLNRVTDRFAQLAPGHLLFVRDGVLMSQPFDVERLAMTGEATEIAPYPDVQPPVSGSGTLAYGGALPPKQLAWFGRDGHLLEKMGEPGLDLGNPRVSPDDSMIAFNRYERGPGDVWLFDAKRGASQLTFGIDSEGPIWSADGRHVAYSLLVGGGSQLVQRASSGVGGEELLGRVATGTTLDDWSLDGEYLLFEAIDTKSKRDVWVMPLSGDRKAFPYLKGDDDESGARLSPNRKWLAYFSDKLGHFEVYVDTFIGDASNSATRGTWQVSSGGGTRPIWSRDGKELFFVGADRRMMVVKVNDTSGDRFDFSAPTPLFETRISGNPFDQFDVSRDGRFLMPVPIQQSAPDPITVIVNWPAGLKH